MKQAWEDLGTEYESSSSVLIGDADCTVEQVSNPRTSLIQMPLRHCSTCFKTKLRRYSGVLSPSFRISLRLVKCGVRGRVFARSKASAATPPSSTTCKARKRGSRTPAAAPSRRSRPSRCIDP
jgi:hypothetical protein